MRAAGAVIAGVVAALALLAALPLLWVSVHVNDEGGWVRLMASLPRDDAVSDAVADEVGQRLATQTSVPEQLRSTVQGAVRRALTRTVSDPEFQKAWDASMRASHREMFDDPRDLDPELDHASNLVIDVGPLARYAVSRVTGGVPGLEVAPAQMVVPLSGSPQGEELDRLRAVPGQAMVAVVIAALAAAGCLLLARRRGTALAALGGIAVLVAVIVKLASGALVDDALARNTSLSAVGHAVLDALVETALSSLDTWLLITAGVGVAALVVGGVRRLTMQHDV